MKKVLLFLTLFLIFSCKEEVKKDVVYTHVEGMSAPAPEQLGKEIFEGKGTCIACHQPDTKVIGPSITEIAKKYKEQNGNLVAFLKEESEPIVDPSQYEVMRTNFAVTKTFSEEELSSRSLFLLPFEIIFRSYSRYPLYPRKKSAGCRSYRG